MVVGVAAAATEADSVTAGVVGDGDKTAPGDVTEGGCSSARTASNAACTLFFSFVALPEKHTKNRGGNMLTEKTFTVVKIALRAKRQGKTEMPRLTVALPPQAAVSTPTSREGK